MTTELYNRRYSLFLLSFLLMLFGDIFVSQKYDYDAQTFLILTNMLFSLPLFFPASKSKKIVIIVLMLLGTFSRIFLHLNPTIMGFVFLFTYLVYFLLVSYQVYSDLLFQEELGIETIAAAFSGYILLGTVFSIIFITMGSHGTFKGPAEVVPNSDYLYFSFVTLLTIGFGDIVPVSDMAKKVVVLLGLMGHFYTVFVVGIVIGKFLKKQG